MEDKRRILEMVREGVLTPEEALELLSVLEERELAGGERPPVEASQVFAPQGFRVQVQAFGASLEVVGVAGLEGLEAEGVGVTQEGGIPVYRVSLGEGRLRVPEGAEVMLLAKGSHVDLAGVVLKGRALGANLEGDRLLGLDLALSGGNLEAGLFLRDGEHRLEVRAGNAEIRFLPGSDLEVEAQVRLGGLEVAGPWRQVAASGGRRWSLGEGKAKLRARVAMGNLELEA
ncbi:SHOCT-like domain-containing protein [Thermus antranikianii]|uniref:YvlB/LiaX N-terminal domain-containing protein n=1 Tax=Thermus antranikianii TaxID=88190 RepID=A0ABY7RQ27_9DEIN|nr:hypothetical protein [Thermus antranikianii]WCM38996.1 hypothetical protein GO600_02080 [Thermus antranikianii]